MFAIWLRLRAELRRRWGRTLTLVLLVGISAGAVLTATTGARRTASAFPRMLEAAGAPDVDVVDPLPDRDYAFDAVASRPEVEYATEVAIMPTLLVDESGGPLLEEFLDFTTLAPTSRRGIDTVSVPKVLEGRLPEPTRVGEIVVNREFADDFGLDAGDDFEYAVIEDGREAAAWVEGGTQGEVPEYSIERFLVTGIALAPFEVVHEPGAAQDGVIHHTPAYFERHTAAAVGYAQSFRLRDPGDVGPFESAIEGLLPDGSDVDIARTAPRYEVVQRAIRPQAVALAVFAAALGLMCLLLVGQALHRQLSVDAVDQPVLRALGLEGSQLIAVGSLRAAAVAIGGGALAVALAMVLSPLMPIGSARDAEPNPGLAFDWSALAVGAAAVVVATLGLGTLAAWRASRWARAGATVASDRSSRVVSSLSRAGLAPAGVIGVRMALEPGRGRAAVPVRTTIVGAATAVGAVTAAVMFAASLNHLLDTPRLYGWDWDAEVTIDTPVATLEDVASAVEPVLRADADVAEWSSGVVSATNLDGRPVPAVGIDPTEGEVFPTVVLGRVPARDDEVALGSRTLDRLGVSLADEVHARFGGEERDLRVVGQVVLPAFVSAFDGNRTELGEGALLTRQAMIDLGPPVGQGLYLVRFRGGTDVPAATDRLRREVEASGLPLVVNDLRRPPEIVNYDRVRTTPQVLAGIMAVAAVVALAHALLTGARRRRRDLAVLKTLGFVRRQVSATVAWQASTVALLALLVGMPVGVAGGRWAWTLFVEQLGAVAAPVSPWVALALAVPIALLVANAVGAVPATIAARTRPAVVLRAE